VKRGGELVRRVKIMLPTKLDTILSGVDPATGEPFIPKGGPARLNEAVEFVMSRLSEQQPDEFTKRQREAEITEKIKELVTEFLTEGALDASRTPPSVLGRERDAVERAAKILSRLRSMGFETQELLRSGWPGIQEASEGARGFLSRLNQSTLPSETRRRSEKQKTTPKSKTRRKTWKEGSRHWLIKNGQRLLKSYCGSAVATLKPRGDLEDFVELLFRYATNDPETDWNIAQAIRQLKRTDDALASSGQFWH
jgi:hypothetical protein